MATENNNSTNEENKQGPANEPKDNYEKPRLGPEDQIFLKERYKSGSFLTETDYQNAGFGGNAYGSVPSDKA